MSDLPPQKNFEIEWILQPQIEPPTWFLEQVQAYIQAYTSGSSGRYAAQLLWQRGIQDGATLAKFIDPQNFKPSSPSEFGWEMQWAVERILHAASSGEKVAIWGDFDADGITSTCVLWDGLGEFFPQNTKLTYYIPNRFTDSHGLNVAGIDRLAKEGISLIVTCDTGSTNLAEINHANELGIDVIITDHHTLLDDRPPVVAIINPRYLPPDHSMFYLSGVAVAYKLIEALYLAAPNIPQAPLEQLLDLVAIGLIADLVELKGDCRYLAQIGLKHLEKEFKQHPSQWRRPGLGRLLELCKKTGDRPTDISFGIGPRINAVSRIHGDAAFCVELLTSRERNLCQKLASEAELANARRQELQKNVLAQAKTKLEKIDLSTTKVIVLEDPQWSVGVLGLVAGQIAQEYGCPTILLTTDQTQESLENSRDAMRSSGSGETTPVLARGSARSVHQIDLYQLVKNQAHLLDRFGGHPLAAGLSLPVENIPLFTEAINRELRQQIGEINRLGIPIIQADIICKVADLGLDLFRELKILEPCGMGNPSPQILIKNCWFERVWNEKVKDNTGRKLGYIKTYFNIKDDSSDSGFPGIWWGHYKEDIPQKAENPSQALCDAIATLDYNNYKKQYELRLIAVREVNETRQITVVNSGSKVLQILDYRNNGLGGELPVDESLDSAIFIRQCPTSWEDLEQGLKLALDSQFINHKLPVVVLAYDADNIPQPQEICQKLITIADHLSHTGASISRQELCQELTISDRALDIGLNTLTFLGFQISFNQEASELETGITFRRIADKKATITANYFPIDYFIAALQEEQFYRQYFCQVPVSTIEAIAQI
ncbi:single-stranded-DNA-specific exonuclease RecJ [Planktothricoides raciborskii]|uniref:Single-stranded-DNA-specific exonuclease RecJ n=1 Tax=Planktothricoides raciborskii GIHE-MW2 TaxID=2792601 RepID=A0AAU8JBN1_9CYAN